MLMLMRIAIIRCQVSSLPRYPLHETAVRQTHACFLTPEAADWMICDPFVILIQQDIVLADKGSHAMVPIIPNKVSVCSVRSQGQVTR
jgi:hypothetical protein